MIETPLAIFNILAIAAAAHGFRDAARRLRHGHQRSRQGDARAPGAGPRADAAVAVRTCVAAARAYGIDILDGVYNDIGNADGFAPECAQGVDLGFDGKTLIHPNQIEPCNKAFSPTRGRGRAGAQDDRRVRPAGEQGQGRGVDRRPHGRAPACRHGARTVAIAEAIARVAELAAVSRPGRAALAFSS